MDSEVPPPSMYASKESKEHTMLLKKMAKKQQNKNSHKKSHELASSTTRFDEKKYDDMKKQISSTCDCVAEIGLTIERIDERIKTDIETLKNEFNSKFEIIEETTNKQSETLKNEFNSKLDIIGETTNKQAQKQLNMEVAITELYKKVQFIEQILISSDDRDNLDLVSASSISEKNVLETNRNKGVETNLPKLKPSDVQPTTPPPPQSITPDNVKPDIDNNLVDNAQPSIQSAGTHSITIHYEI